MSNKPLIVGAGLAGLITACAFPGATIIEAGPQLDTHKALLRFRDESVSHATGIPFKEVRVYKGIFWQWSLRNECDIQMANEYSSKVTGSYRGRSIWNLAPSTRYIAPEDFHSQLVELHRSRINWDNPFTSEEAEFSRLNDVPIISTMPLPAMLNIVCKGKAKFEMENSPIRVSRFRMPAGTDVYQTIYFPESDLKVFRASITGDLLIIERIQREEQFIWRFGNEDDTEVEFILEAFGMTESISDLERLEDVTQKYGKIIELPKEDSAAIVYSLTRDYGIFSVGRFATWRNILLDDVVGDIQKVKKLIKATDAERFKAAARA